jgi:hypothetical protein
VSRRRRRPAPELPALSLWTEPDETLFLVIWFAGLEPGEAPLDYGTLRADYEEAVLEVLPARVPRRFRKTIH